VTKVDGIAMEANARVRRSGRGGDLRTVIAGGIVYDQNVNLDPALRKDACQARR
jgi:hypothetical protein